MLALAAQQFEKDWIENTAAYEAHELKMKYEKECEYTLEEHQKHWDKELKFDQQMNNPVGTEAKPIMVNLQSIAPILGAKPTRPLTSHLVPDCHRC